MLPSNQNLHICNPFMLRESLAMALEVSACDMTPEDVLSLRALLVTLRHGTEFDVMELSTPAETETAVSHCLEIFKRTKTWQWMRGDFRDSILKLEHSIRRSTQMVAGCEP